MSKNDMSAMDQEADPVIGHRIVIASEKTSEGRRAVVGGCQGVNFQIPRDTEVVISLPVLEILRNAMVPEVEFRDETINVRMVRRYPISDMGPVKASEGVAAEANADVAA